jgi:hypothetical protein
MSGCVMLNDTGKYQLTNSFMNSSLLDENIEAI